MSMATSSMVDCLRPMSIAVQLVRGTPVYPHARFTSLPTLAGILQEPVRPHRRTAADRPSLENLATHDLPCPETNDSAPLAQQIEQMIDELPGDQVSVGTLLSALGDEGLLLIVILLGHLHHSGVDSRAEHGVWRLDP